MFTRPLLRLPVQRALCASRRSFFYKREVGIPRDFLLKIQDFLNPDRSFKQRVDEKLWKSLVEDQKYIEERHNTLGPDLGTAHFVVARGGSVKFVGHEHWITEYDLPDRYVPDLYLEAINASGLPIMYDSMQNFVYLDKLCYLNFSKCEYFDDFCLGLLHRFEKTLVHLNISRCPLVTGAGFEILHRLKNLRILEAHGMINVENQELLAIMLEDALPMCQVEGIDYTNKKKLSMLGDNELIDEELDRIESVKLLKSSPAKLVESGS